MYHPQRLNTKNQMMLQILHFMRSVVLKECLQNACSCRVSYVLSQHFLVLSIQRVSTQFSKRWRCSYLQQPISSAHMLNILVSYLCVHELPLLAKLTISLIPSFIVLNPPWPSLASRPLGHFATLMCL